MARASRQRHRCFIPLLFVLLGAVPAAGQGARPSSGPGDAGERDRPRQRERYFRQGRTVRGESAAALRYRAFRRKMANRSPAQRSLSPAVQGLASAQAPPPVPLGSPWVSLGPAPIAVDPSALQDFGLTAGRVTSVVVDQNDLSGNTVYAGGAYGGVWKSSNAADPNPAAVHWAPLTDGQATLATGAIAIQPGDPNTVLVGTGEPNASIDSYYGLGILRSADGGATWSLITTADSGAKSFKGLGFSKIAFSADNPSLVVAASASTNATGLGIDTTNIRGLYYSQDSGLTWQYASVQDGGVTTSPGSSSSVLYVPAQHKFFAAVRFHGFYSSSDGANWSRLAAQPGGSLLSPAACPPQVLTTCPMLRAEMAVQPATGDLYVWFIDPNLANRGVFKTSDGGLTWVAVGINGMTACGDSQGCGTSDQGDYDLDLAAVPNLAGGTDLYAGAINLYKCSLPPGSSNCAAWLNLTHVYGCAVWGQPAHVHPDQHAVDFSHAHPDLMYFGNDGGVYRARNGFLLNGGSCSSNNPFDDLNGTLGSLTELVSFSQHPTDLATLLGGGQDVGSFAIDATHNGANGATWESVYIGDGGFNAINPADPLEWFTANTYVSILRCSLGIDCNAASFPSVIIGSSQVGGDTGDFYTPYILDPGLPSRITVGTCRVWRGPSSGIGWTASNALSWNFDTSSPALCSGNESNIITALAAGGAVSNVATGGSQVIYAGTGAGNIFVTTNAAAGPASWTSQNVSPSGFKISDIALDPADPTGHTAYAAIMGFGGPHVMKTTNAGGQWLAFSGDLPDAPADSVLVDPNDSTVVYVGTDVGLFVTTNGGLNWAEWGTGLPNAPITRLRAFVSPDRLHNKLRASTYGRGVWQNDLVTGTPFRMSVAPASASAFPGQSATFVVSLTPQSGFTGTVTLSCDGGGNPLPAACQGGVADLASGPVQFTATAGDPSLGTFSFLIKGVGSDANSTTFEIPVTLLVADFALTLVSTNPSPLSVGHSSSGEIDFTVASLGPFTGIVALSCPGAPAGITCDFLNFDSGVGLVPTTVAAVVGKVFVAGNVPVGNYNLTLDGASGSGDHSLSISLAVTVNPIFLMTPGPSVSVVATGTAHQSVTLTSQDGYAGTVNLTAGGGGTVTPSTVSSFPTTVDVATPTSLGWSGPFWMQLNGVDANDSSKTNSTQAPFTVMDYRATGTLGLNAPILLFPGQAGSFTFTLGLTGEFGYTGDVAYACSSDSNPPPTCVFSPPGPVAVAGAPVSVATSLAIPAITTPGNYLIAINTNDVAFPGLREITGASFSVQDFQISSLGGTSWTVKAGVPLSLMLLNLNTINGTTFQGTVNFDPATSCSGLPPLASCSFSPLSATPSGPTVILTINTTAPRAELLPPGSQRRAPQYALWIALSALVAGVAAAPGASRRRRAWIGYLLLAVLLALLSMHTSGCGGGGGSVAAPPLGSLGTPPGTYNITVTGRSTNGGMTVSHSVQITLTVQ